MPDSFARMPEGRVLIANGMDPMLRWDGLQSTTESAGVLAPASAPTLAGTGLGGIVGVYFAYVRFVDTYFNVSNLSPISASYSAQSAAGAIQNVTASAPIVIQANGHGLTDAAVVKIANVGGVTNANNIWEITVIDANNFSLDLSDGFSQTYTGGGTWSSGVASIVYSNIPAPSESKVVRRQILRNTDGQLTTFYVDVDTDDMQSPSLTSSLVDNLLTAQQAVPLLDSNGIPFANSHGVPPAHKKSVTGILGRMFAAGEVNYTRGAVAVTVGSTQVQGIGTEWTASFPGRFLYVHAAQQSYEIASIDPIAQAITLLAPYRDPTSAFSAYAIRPAPAEGRLVYYSEAGESESWPAINALSLDADGDEITAVLSVGSFLYIAERLHIYRFTFQDDPATDGHIYLGLESRGLANNHCWVSIDDQIYCLDAQGIHAYDGGEGSESISNEIQDIFREGDGPYTINWAASEFFHCLHYQPQEVVRWFVSLSGHYLPQHALCYQYRLKRWWIEEFAHPVGASLRGLLDGRAVAYLGADAGRVLAFWTNLLDGADATAGTVRGTATSATLLSLSDSAAHFASSGIVNTPIAIIDGTGVDQVRRIVSVSGNKITIDLPWAKLPDATSVYQIGAIPWQWRSGWFRYISSEEQTERRIELIWEPTEDAAIVRMQMFLDSDTPGHAVIWKTRYTSPDANGVRSDPGSTDLIIDLTKTSGFAQKRIDSRRETYIDGPRFMMLDLRGVVNEDEVTLDQITLDGVMR